MSLSRVEVALPDCELCWMARETSPEAAEVARRMGITSPSATVARINATGLLTFGSYMRIAAFFGTIAAVTWLTLRQRAADK